MPMQVRYDMVNGRVSQTLAISRGGPQLCVTKDAMELGRWVRFAWRWPRWYCALHVDHDLQPADRFRVMMRAGRRDVEYVMEVNESPLGAGTFPRESDWRLWLRTWPACRWLRRWLP